MTTLIPNDTWHTGKIWIRDLLFLIQAKDTISMNKVICSWIRRETFAPVTIRNEMSQTVPVGFVSEVSEVSEVIFNGNRSH